MSLFGQREMSWWLVKDKGVPNIQIDNFLEATTKSPDMKLVPGALITGPLPRKRGLSAVHPGVCGVVRHDIDSNLKDGASFSRLRGPCLLGAATSPVITLGQKRFCGRSSCYSLRRSLSRVAWALALFWGFSLHKGLLASGGPCQVLGAKSSALVNMA